MKTQFNRKAWTSTFSFCFILAMIQGCNSDGSVPSETSSTQPQVNQGDPAPDSSINVAKKPQPTSSPTSKPTATPLPSPTPTSSPVPSPTATVAPVSSGWTPPATGQIVVADPQTVSSLMSSLKAGDHLQLKPGTYSALYLSNMHGTVSNWIVIESQDRNNLAVIDGNPNSNNIELTQSTYVALRGLKLDGMNNDASFGISASGADGTTHDIFVEGNQFVRFSGGQQQDAISTKTATWNWTIRGNQITDAGTGMYLGNSTGANAFIGGVIENNFFQDTMGYNIQIKWQATRPAMADAPTAPQRTIIRNNVFMKVSLPSPDGARPNLLVNGGPNSGTGSQDTQEIYGNFFYDNPSGESLFQAAGRVIIHDNIFVKSSNAGIVLQAHDSKNVELAHVFDNTFYDMPTGISVGSNSGDVRLVGNLIFAATAISGSAISVNNGNITDSVANATTYVLSPSSVLGSMDFYPKSGQAQGTALDMSAFSSATDLNKDFNGSVRSTYTFRGAYAGQGSNPGWKLNQGFKGN